jgi:phosphoglycolate phosphatase
VEESATAANSEAVTLDRPIELVVFDLDGTLIDSQRDLVLSVNATRAHLGLAPLEDDRIASYVGNGAPVLIRRALGDEVSQPEVDCALEFFLGYYREHMLDNTQLYPGVRESLDRLAQEGVLMAVLTNKPVRFSQALVDGLGVGPHFRRVYGGNSFPEKKPHPMGATTLMRELSVAPESTLMVGDSAVDVRTARNAGMLCCGVTFGFQPESFAEFPPHFLVDRMEEVTDLVLRTRTG